MERNILKIDNRVEKILSLLFCSSKFLAKFEFFIIILSIRNKFQQDSVNPVSSKILEILNPEIPFYQSLNQQSFYRTWNDPEFLTC